MKNDLSDEEDLVAGTDYTYTIKEGTVRNAGTYHITVTGDKNYTGAGQLTFNVNKANTNDVTVKVSPASDNYNDEIKTPAVTLSIGGVTLSAGDYTTKWVTEEGGDAKLKEAGKYKLHIAGDNITGGDTENSVYEIKGTSIANATVTGYKSKVWVGGPIADASAIKVVVNGKTLDPDEDYVIGEDYINPASAGTKTFTITGNGNYSGTKTITFTAVAQNLTNYGKVTLKESSYAYDGTAHTPEMTVTLEGTGLDTKTLEEETNFTATYTNSSDGTNNQTDVGTVTVKVSGAGDVTGSATAKYEITAFDISSGKIEATAGNYNLGTAVAPGAVTVYDSKGDDLGLTEDDYTVSYKNNTDAGDATITITGKGNYTGTLTGTYKINPIDWDAAQLVVSGYDEEVAYTGSQIKPSGLTVVNKENGKILVEDKDYELSYGGNVDIGAASFTLKAKGNYAGAGSADKTIPFTIVAANLEKVAEITAKAQTYTGKELTPVVVTQKLSDGTTKTLTADKDYKVVYESNTNAGTAKYTVTGIETAGYTGTKSGEFTINKAVTKAKITKLVSKNGKKAIAPKKTLQLVATQTPTKADANHTLKNTITWTSSNKKIATVSTKGKVKGVKTGTATITAKSADGSKKTFKVTVVGVTNTAARSIKVGKSVKIAANDTIKKATATSGKAYVKVSKSGKNVTVKGVKAGTAKVTITTANGGKDVITVKVK